MYYSSLLNKHYFYTDFVFAHNNKLVLTYRFSLYNFNTMIRRIYLAAFLILTFVSNLFSSDTKKTFTIVSYNVENLFDTQNDTQKKDNDFTPTGKKAWNTKRYTHKLSQLAKVIKSINKTELPEIVGLTEVENEKVVQDLINTPALKSGNYKIVHKDSPDIRGIDCALIYRPDEFTYVSHKTYPVNYKNSDYPSRDILHVTGKNRKGEIMHIFVNHWNSRIGGVQKSEPKRIHAAKILKRAFDKILKKNRDAKIIAIGDFNDEPSNNSLKYTLRAADNSSKNKNTRFYNLMYSLHNNKKGTYSYKNNWNMLDNIIISKSLLNKGKLKTKLDSGKIFNPNWICYKNRKGQYTPNRTYAGKKYFGGFSDHFPVYFKLKY